AADGQAYYHNERTNQTAWTLPAGAACREPGLPGAAAQGAQQAAEDDPFAYLRQQEEDLRKQREEYAQWYAQYSAWYAQQQATGAAQGSEAGEGSGEKHGSGAQQSQGGPKDGAQGGPSGAAKDRVPLRLHPSWTPASTTMPPTPSRAPCSRKWRPWFRRAVLLLSGRRL
ncbi:unnamed protein product, partial [Polarella glacialis]